MNDATAAHPVSSDERPAASAQLPHVPLWLLALFTFSGTLAMHIFVPSLGMAGRDLQASTSAMQMTVSLYILGLAAGQLVYGPLSDRYGRRPVLMVGLGLYTIAGLGAALAPDAYALIAARLFQALGGCAGLVLGRAIVRDTASAANAAKRLALMNLMVTVAPALAPIAGGALAGVLGWRAVLGSLCVLGLANLVLAWRLLPETGPVAAQVSARSLARDYVQLLGSRRFLGLAIGGGCATTSMFAFIASAPFIFVDQLHRPPSEVGVYLAVLVSGVWLGSAIATRIIGRLPIDRVMVGGNLLSVISTFVMLALVLAGWASVPGLVGPMFLFTLGAGIASPAALTLAVSVNPKVIGSASGLYGCAQMAMGALCTALAGLGSSPTVSAAVVMASAGAVSQLAFWVALRDRPRTADPA
ncbi:multidrug effflux MFS transporter [Bordetella genomosp. 13]|uniref:Bcr/CflA family efflux transporter n=1 Tax=Bordetella genomosp. 13 TaxID=463040 RepID=A0A1W6Z9N4_9BORD|nr:multidrug effflux MFS transporter [Bordetella genomosp. 13]ARP93870.1 Bcr/CflA family drug resistance efflux transporter [Bordetella genomosp. 13]